VDTSHGAECAEEFTMAQRHRPTYTPEFKAEAVRLVRTSSERFTKVARDLGVSVST
jgi:transposase-like protein